MRTSAIAVALVATALALVVPATAASKEVKEGTVCGASGCETVTDRALLMALLDGGGNSSEPPQAAGFYEVEIVMAAEGEQHTFQTQMVPSRNAMRANDGAWMQLPAAARRALNRVIGDDLEPYPAVGLIGAAPAPDPASAADPGGLSWLEASLLVGALILLTAGLIAVQRRRAVSRAVVATPPAGATTTRTT